MKHFLLPVFLFALVPVMGQITIDQGDFPNANDTAMISISDDVMLDFATTGANSVWDFSDLHIASQRIDTFYNVADASALYQLQFNNVLFEPDYASDYYYNLVGFDLAGASDAGITINKPVGFVKISSTVVENVGMGMELNGYEIPMAADTIDTEYVLPMNYLDTWTSYSYLYVDLNPAFNGIFVRHQDRSSEVDGWGQITTNFGTFDVIRVKSQLTYSDSAYVDFGLGGTWVELPTPPQNEYTWWSEGNKVPVLRIVTQDIAGSETVTRCEFKDKERNLAGIDEKTFFAGQMYPNPADNEVTFMLDQGAREIRVYSMTGEEVGRYTISGSMLTLDVSGWSRGIYLVKLLNDEGVSTTKLCVE